MKVIPIPLHNERMQVWKLEKPEAHGEGQGPARKNQSLPIQMTALSVGLQTSCRARRGPEALQPNRLGWLIIGASSEFPDSEAIGREKSTEVVKGG